MKVARYLVLIISFAVHAQQAIQKSSLDSGGTPVTNGSKQLLYTVGEVVTMEASQYDQHLSEGFINAGIFSSIGIKDYGMLQGVQVYPNPVQTNLYIQLLTDTTYECDVFDLNGKKLKNFTFEGNHTMLNLTDLVAGMYIIALVDREHQLSKIIKIHKI